MFFLALLSSPLLGLCQKDTLKLVNSEGDVYEVFKVSGQKFYSFRQEEDFGKISFCDSLFDYQAFFFKADTLLRLPPLYDGHGFVFMSVLLDEENEFLACEKSQYVRGELEDNLIDLFKSIDFRAFFTSSCDGVTLLRLTLCIDRSHCLVYFPASSDMLSE